MRIRPLLVRWQRACDRPSHTRLTVASRLLRVILLLLATRYGQPAAAPTLFSRSLHGDSSVRAASSGSAAGLPDGSTLPGATTTTATRSTVNLEQLNGDAPPPDSPPWELQLVPYLTDLAPLRDPNATTLRGPPRLVGTYKGNWLRGEYGDSLRPQDLLTQDRGVIIMHLPEDLNTEPAPGQPPGAGGELAGGMQDLRGELVIRDGPRITDRDMRFRIKGTYVAAAGTVHAVLEPQLPVRAVAEPEKEDPQQRGTGGLQGGGSARSRGAGGGGGGEGSGGYREALRTAARHLIAMGPGWHRVLLRAGPPPPPHPTRRLRRAGVGEEAPPRLPPSPPRPPLELALLKTCEFRADFRVYYKGDPDAKSHVQFLRLDEPAPPPPQTPPPSWRRQRAPAAAGQSGGGALPAAVITSAAGGETHAPAEGAAKAAKAAAGADGAAAATGTGSLARRQRQLSADTEIYHSTQVQLHGGDADAAAAIAAAGDDDVAADVGPDSVYGIPAGMDPRDPDLELVGLIMSPNCDLSLHFNASAVHLERYFRQALRYSALVATITIAQIVLSVSQAEASSSPSASARMSLYSVTLQAIMDAYQCLLHLTGALVVDALFGAFASIAFLQFLLFAVFEMRQTLLVWRAQRNAANANGDFWTVRRDMSAVYTRFYAMLLLGLLMMFQFQSQLGLLVLIMHSWWLPQLVHSARTDTRPPLKTEYVWGMSALRLIMPLYFFGCPSNLLRVELQPGVCVVLVMWVTLQAALLTAQIRFGPRVYIPRAMLPRRYDYHRGASRREMGIEDPTPQPPSAAAAGVPAGAAAVAAAGLVAASSLGGRAVLRRLAAWLPSGAWFRRPPVVVGTAARTAATRRSGGGSRSGGGAASDGDVETGQGSKECVICMNPVPLQPLTSRMLTPCGHFFHEPCLTRWMEVKMDCPTCRRPLPPV